MENYVGKRLDGRYEIIEIIGVGGMAVVYKAFDNIDNRIVAVKILKDEYIANEDFRRRFKNESKAIAVLSHPNIVKVFDVSYGNLLQYIVMEYVDGITLKEYIEQQGVVDTREAVYFVTQILRALQHAHDKGIVHRDIKPQNIMLISDGTIKVTDFGIARFSRGETKTMNGEAIGSIHYISPEQVKGSITDAKTDIYAVGVMFYEMLTGKLPFESDNTAQLILMQIQKDPVMPREINEELPVGLEQIVIRAMQKNQLDRYQSASEMLMDIEKFKQNPNVKFDYSYYVDTQPTKYISAEEAQAAVEAQSEPAAVVPVEDDELFDTAGDDHSKKKTIGILIAVLAALVIGATVILAVFMPDKNKISVPSFVGMNYETEILNASEYKDFKFEVVDDNDSDEASGTVLKQEPSNGKVLPGSTITVYVAAGQKLIEIPDVYEYEYSSAQTALKSMNFEVKIEKEPSTEFDSGIVIRTSPERGEMAESGSVVIVYVATDKEETPVDVPNLIGKTIAEAKEELEKVGLVLDTERTEYRSSPEERGQIIGYEGLGEQVKPGTKIAVYVSTGKTPEEETTEETTVEETTTEKVTETTTVKPTEETTVRPSEATTAKPAETTTEKPTEKPTEAETTTKPTEPVTTAPAVTEEKTTVENTTQKPTETTTEKVTEAETTRKFITTVPSEE